MDTSTDRTTSTPSKTEKSKAKEQRLAALHAAIAVQKLIKVDDDAKVRTVTLKRRVRRKS